MSYAARNVARRGQKLRASRAAIRLEIADAQPILKWHYGEHPWWLKLSVKRRWVRSLSEAFRMEADWYKQWPNDVRPDRIHQLCFMDRPFFATVAKS